MSSETKLSTLDSVMDLDKSQTPPVDTSDFFMVVKGHEDFSVQIQSGGMPLPRRQAMDYSTMVGVKSQTAGKVQMWQSNLPIALIERESLDTKNMLIRLLADNYDDRNKLTIEYWVGNARDVKAIKWATMKYAFLSNEDGAEFDTESESTPLKISGASISGWVVFECPERNLTTLANAIATLDKMTTNSGLEKC